MPELLIPYTRIEFSNIVFSLKSVARWIEGKGTPINYDLYENDYKKEGESLAGFWLPPFQRPEVWETERKIRLIESLFCEIDVGTLMFVSSYENPETDGWLIDGQQRLSAIRDFVNGKFGVFDDRLWYNELKDTRLNFPENRVEKNALVYFGSLYLNFRRINECDPKVLERIYERMNFGGVPHQEKPLHEKTPKKTHTPRIR